MLGRAFAGGLLLYLAACGETRATGLQPPHAHLAEGDRIDLGIGPAGDRGVELTLVNRGQSAMVLREVKASCGCAMDQLKPGREFPVGESNFGVAIHLAPGDRREVRFALLFENAPAVVFTVVARAALAAGLVFESAVDLGVVRLGQERRVELPIRIREAARELVTEDDRFKELNWAFGAPGVCRIAAEEEIHGQPWSGERTIKPILVVEPTRAGPRETWVKAYFGDVPMRFTVRWTAETEMDVRPDTIVLECRDDRWQGRAIIESEHPLVRVEVDPVEGLDYKLDPTAAGAWQLTVEADGFWVRSSEGIAQLRLRGWTVHGKEVTACAMVALGL